MKEIKIKCWDGERMYYPSTSLWDGSFTCKSEDEIFMLYTGVNDINGDEIYEGDIVNTIDGNFTLLRWGEDDRLVFQNDEGEFPYYDGKYVLTIIGNINETKNDG